MVARRPVERARKRVEQKVVVLAVADRPADPVREDAHHQAFPHQHRAELLRLVDRDEEEVRPRRKRLEPELGEHLRAALALLDLRGHIGRIPECREGEGRRDPRDRLRRLAAIQLRSRLRIGERVADSRAREAERLGEGAQDDDSVSDEIGGRLARVLEVRLVDDERPCGRQRDRDRRSGCSDGSRT